MKIRHKFNLQKVKRKNTSKKQTLTAKKINLIQAFSLNTDAVMRFPSLATKRRLIQALQANTRK